MCERELNEVTLLIEFNKRKLLWERVVSVVSLAEVYVLSAARLQALPQQV